MKDILFVYYSFEGNTQFAAETAAKLLDLDLQRLIPDKEPPKKGLGKFLQGGGSALKKEPVQLKPLAHDAAKYEKIIIGYPVWAGTYPPAVAAFLAGTKLNGKKIYLIGCSASGNAKKSFDSLKAALDGSETAGTLSLKNPSKDKENTEKLIKEFADKIKGTSENRFEKRK